MEAGRYCRGCLYDLAGVEHAPEAVCPECGRAYDLLNPRTTLARPRRLWQRIVLGPVGRCTALLTVLLTLLWLTWLPRPDMDGLGLWVWLGREYGSIVIPSDEGRMRMTIRAGRVARIAGLTEEGDDVWSVRRAGDGTWRIDVLSGTARWREILGAMNRLAVLDVSERWDAPDSPIVSAPARFTGSDREVVGAIMSAFSVKPGHRVWRDGDRWGAELTDPETGLGRMFTSFNALRDSRFGVRVLPPALQGPPAPPTPFRVEGTEADVFWAILESFALTVDEPNRVPARSDGWHPTGVIEYDPQPMAREAPGPRRLDHTGRARSPRLVR